MTRRASVHAFALAVALASTAHGARAADVRDVSRRETVLLLPTLTPGGDDAAGKALHAPTVADGEVRARADELDATLREAIEDSGFSLAIPDADELARGLRDSSLVERATAGEHGRWVLSPRLEREAGRWHLRFVAVAPGDRELRVRIDEATTLDLPARALVALRQLLLRRSASQPVAPLIESPASSAQNGVLAPPRTSGRMILALTGAAFGAFGGYAVERSSGSSDSRLVFPLIAVGSTVGAGAAILAADEWNLASDSAYAVGLGVVTGTIGGYALGREYASGSPEISPFAYGVSGGVVGLALSIRAVSQSTGTDVAPIIGSGAFLGALGGGLTARMIDGGLHGSPTLGVGEGIGAGLVAAAVLASVAQPDPNRLVNLDFGAGLGALVGAAAGSPFLLQSASTSTGRAFLACTTGGALAGGILGWWLAPSTVTARPMSVGPMLGQGTGLTIAGVF